MTPRISVLVPTRDRRETLAQTLDDLRAQTRDDFEIIVGDDASSDDTPALLAGWPDPRLRVLRHDTNVGIYANWNALLREARGEFVAIYHDHDVYLPSILERSAARLEADTDMAMVHTAVVMVDDALKPLQVDVRPLPETIPGGDFRRLLVGMAHSPVMAAATLVRRTAYEAVGPFDDSRYGLGCDKEMWFRLASVGSIGYIREPQAFIRARTRGEGTARFRWASALGGWRMRLDQIAAVEGPTDEERVRLTAVARGEIARTYALLMIRVATIGTPEERREGEAIATELGLPIPRAYRTFKAFAPARAAARGLLLPRHYARLEAREAQHRQETAAFMREHPELERALVQRRPGAVS